MAYLADAVAVARHKRDVAKQKIAREVNREVVDLDHESLRFSRDAGSRVSNR